MFLELSITAVVIGAITDGLSTDWAIKNRNAVEVDPIMVAIFGTNEPTEKTIFLRGGLAILAESAIVLLVGHFHPSAGRVLSLGLLGQTSYHIWATVHNFRIK